MINRALTVPETALNIELLVPTASNNITNKVTRTNIALIISATPNFFLLLTLTYVSVTTSPEKTIPTIKFTVNVKGIRLKSDKILNIPNTHRLSTKNTIDAFSTFMKLIVFLPPFYIEISYSI